MVYRGLRGGVQHHAEFGQSGTDRSHAAAGRQASADAGIASFCSCSTATAECRIARVGSLAEESLWTVDDLAAE